LPLRGRLETSVQDEALPLNIVFTGSYLYSFGVYQDYYVRIYLSNHSPSSIAWIGSLEVMFNLAMGLVSGKLFDEGYFHAVEIFSGSLFVFSLFMLSLAKPFQYYQIFLAQGVGMGLGIGLTFVPTVSITVHHFRHRRGLASGVALSGSSAGALVFPIMLNHLLPRVGFGQAVRATAYLAMAMIIMGNLLMRTRLPPRSKRPPSSAPPPSIKSFFTDAPYMFAVAGCVPSKRSIPFTNFIYLGL
jgi:MFS transporter, MCT family, solute carrier family 16 (monocarboxylic acid transporters), member 10